MNKLYKYCENISYHDVIISDNTSVFLRTDTIARRVNFKIIIK